MLVSWGSPPFVTVSAREKNESCVNGHKSRAEKKASPVLLNPANFP